MHILLTRPIEDSKEMILKFKSLDHKISHIPLISIKKLNYDEVDFSIYSGIIFTSSNAIKFLETKNINKKIICFCVGNITEITAKNFGFQNIFSASGNVNNLKEIIYKNFEASDGNLLYVSGENVSIDLSVELTKNNYKIKRLINYKSSKNKIFDDNLIKKLRQNIPDIVFIYSQLSAQSFLELIKNNNFQNDWKNTNLMCLSEKISSVLNEIKWKKIFIFNPGEEEFLLYKI